MENEITGIVQTIRKDRKAIKLNDEWYSSFKTLPNDLEVGENINLTYKENKGFKNIQNFEYVSEKEGKIKPHPIEKKLSDTTVNTILMCSKEILIAHMNKDIKITLEEVTKKVIDAYKQIEAL